MKDLFFVEIVLVCVELCRSLLTDRGGACGGAACARGERRGRQGMRSVVKPSLTAFFTFFIFFLFFAHHARLTLFICTSPFLFFLCKFSFCIFTFPPLLFLIGTHQFCISPLAIPLFSYLWNVFSEVAPPSPLYPCNSPFFPSFSFCHVSALPCHALFRRAPIFFSFSHFYPPVSLF